jgi:hypothetical protein
VRLPRFLTKRVTEAALREAAGSVREITACCQCPFARASFCTHPTDNRINLNGVNTLLAVHKDCPLLEKPLLLRVNPWNDNG